MLRRLDVDHVMHRGATSPSKICSPRHSQIRPIGGTEEASEQEIRAHVTQYKEEGRPAIGLEGHMAQIREETPRAFR